MLPAAPSSFRSPSICRSGHPHLLWPRADRLQSSLYGGRCGLQTTPGAAQALPRVGLVLSIGNRFATGTRGPHRVSGAAEVHPPSISSPPSWQGVSRPISGIVSDAKLAVEALLRVAKETTPKRSPSEMSGKAADYKAASAQDGLRPGADQAPANLQELNESSYPTPSLSPPSACTRSGRGSPGDPDALHLLLLRPGGTPGWEVPPAWG